MGSGSAIKIGRIIALIFLFSPTNGQFCENKETCDDCLSDIDCVWCLKPLNEDLGTHCYNKSTDSTCPENNSINPKAYKNILRDKPIQTSIVNNQKVVLIKPQIIELKLRKDEEYTIDFQYAQSGDLPVDLYYIMDLSKSLEQDKANLASIGRTLVETMRNITGDFKIGFGSFVDKTDAPFISTQPQKLIQPCTGCVAAYSFKNHLSLTENGDAFAEQVQRAPISGNIDVPEGGFDALMQAIVCNDVIGWRNSSTRIIVFTTDAASHVAGDGKLAGIVIPNDGNCHMTNNQYTADKEFDYPSISHINYVAKTHNVHILFVVKDKVLDLYKNLAQAIENSKTIGLKNEDIIREIQSFYKNISTSVKFTSPMSPKVHVSFSSTCKNNNEFSKNIECTNIAPGQMVDFQVKVKPASCFDNIEVIRIKPSTQDSALEIRLKSPCKCENCGPDIPNAIDCNQHGALHCGVCECATGFNGKHCECDQTKNEDFQKFDKCKAGNETEDCSGRGTCRCNVCICEKREGKQLISGKYCECDNFSCPKSGQHLCSNNGECVCGKCKCNPDWSGDACECRNDLTTCTDKDNKVCNDHGTCKCGKCVCEAEYFGQFCDECATCYGGKCDELKPCVECKVHDKGKYKDDCDIKCTQYTINQVDTINDDEMDGSKVCLYVEDNCKLKFTYEYVDEKIVAYALKELQCSQPINVIALISGIIGGILILGIIALITWKCWTNYRDGIEYAKFEEQRERAGWERGDNPLYKSAVTKFENPTYGKRMSSMYKRKTQTS